MYDKDATYVQKIAIKLRMLKNSSKLMQLYRTIRPGTGNLYAILSAYTYLRTWEGKVSSLTT